MPKGTEELNRFISIRLTKTDYSHLVEVATKMQAPKTVLAREAILSYLSEATKSSVAI